MNVHTAGELLRDDRLEVLFSEEAYHENIERKVGGDYPLRNWSYPPTMFWVSSAAAWFEYYTALALWHVIGIAFLCYADY